MATIGQALTQPEVGWRRYDDSIGLIKYEGAWQENPATANSWMGTRHISTNASGKYVKLVFRGTKFRFITNTAGNRSEASIISIDGEETVFTTRFTTSLTVAPSRLAFEKTDLPYGYHTVIITDDTTDYLDVDAFDIDEDGELLRYDYFDNLPLDESLKKYGVCWFGFDESSGQVLDRLGSEYVGTLTGATRVRGWNDKGYAMNFDGNDYVTFDSKILPLDEFAVRFKIKTSASVQSRIFSTTAGDVAGVVVGYYGNTDKTIGIYTNNGTDGSSVTANYVIGDGVWHDVLVSYNKKSNDEIKCYVDGQLILKTKAPYSITNHARNLRLGANNGSTVNLFLNGQMDDFIVYSKSLTPDEISTKNVAIETLDGKVLSLPNKQGRVKELPSNSEDDIVYQGYKWQEVINAVDQDGIETTHTTNEYEVVGKDNTSLGSGKMFTLPISNFKKAKVENNK